MAENVSLELIEISEDEGIMAFSLIFGGMTGLPLIELILPFGFLTVVTTAG